MTRQIVSTMCKNYNNSHINTGSIEKLRYNLIVLDSKSKARTRNKNDKIPYHSDTLKSAISHCLFIDFLSLQVMAERIVAS